VAYMVIGLHREDETLRRTKYIFEVCLVVTFKIFSLITTCRSELSMLWSHTNF
jgi:hypothetical protein